MPTTLLSAYYQRVQKGVKRAPLFVFWGGGAKLKCHYCNSHLHELQFNNEKTYTPNLILTKQIVGIFWERGNKLSHSVSAYVLSHIEKSDSPHVCVDHNHYLYVIETLSCTHCFEHSIRHEEMQSCDGGVKLQFILHQVTSVSIRPTLVSFEVFTTK